MTTKPFVTDSARPSQEPPPEDQTHTCRDGALALLLLRVERFSLLPVDWFGKATLFPSPQTIHSVRVILDELPRHLRLPQATTAGDGDIGLTWFLGSDRFDASVSSQGHISWASKRGPDFPLGECVDQDLDGRRTLYAALDEFYG